MPILTKDQVFEAAMELEANERDEILGRLQAEQSISLTLDEEHKQLIRPEVEAHRNDPTTAISREDLMAKMRVMLR